VGLAPGQGALWNTLGVALYRTGDWRGCIDALEKSMDLTSGGDGSDWLFLAMAHARLENGNEARAWYDKAIAWIEEHRPDDEELGRFREEAEELLGASGSGPTPR
jgi:uncharacterized protein HemY